MGLRSVDAYATQPHYRDHIKPIWEALPAAARGTFGVPRSLSSPPFVASRGAPEGSGPIIVAGYRDLWAVKHRPVIFVEHGSGQTYGGSNPAYPGGRNREAVRLFLCPSERVAALNKARYPKARVEVVGSPLMDRWHRDWWEPEKDLVAVTFHWDALVCPESRWAWPHYAKAIEELAKTRRIIGHAHPRAWRHLKSWYRNVGIRPVSLDEIYRCASVLVVDNSSAGWEFMSLDRPVVWLNAPWYRREIEHGLRFWEYADSGVQVDEPEQLPTRIDLAHLDPIEVGARRRAVIQKVYSIRDGHAAERAANAIVRLLERVNHG